MVAKKAIVGLFKHSLQFQQNAVTYFNSVRFLHIPSFKSSKVHKQAKMGSNIPEKLTVDEGSWLPVNECFSTLAIHEGYSCTNGQSAVVPPITLSTTYELDAPAVNRGFEYTRTGNPSRQILETRLAALDNANYAACFSSGLSAISALLSLLQNGDNIICSDDTYGGTSRLMRESVIRNGIHVDFVDLGNFDAIRSKLSPKTKMIFLESPANPTLRVFDIKQISEVGHEFSKDIIVAVDNTVLTSYFQNPLSLGADLVHYSLTKYANGHADALMGALITNKEYIREKLNYYQNAFGSVPSPFDCFLVTRGLMTLHLRMPALMKTSCSVAEFLENHPKVEKVFHPALISHPQHKIALSQSAGHSGLLSFRIKLDCGSAVKFLENLKIFQNAASFGGCESLAELPAYFTHIMVPEVQRERLGITNNFVRLSVGLEAAKDLIGDLSSALEKC